MALRKISSVHFHPNSLHRDEGRSLPISSLVSAARQLLAHVPTHRIYSVFGRDILSRMFATIWTHQTNIPNISDPCYLGRIMYLTRATLELKKRELPSLPMAQICPAGTWILGRCCSTLSKFCVCIDASFVFHLKLTVWVAPVHSD